jgi:hypothetical protein
MRRMLLAVVAVGGLSAVSAVGAIAAPSAAGVHTPPPQPLVTHVDFDRHHHHWHHRRWDHGRWHFWD